MIICEYGFEEPDSSRPMYSHHEVDFYGHIPYPKTNEIRQHRLSLRKNLMTGKFEVYRFYHHNCVEEVIFSGSLEEALKVAYLEVKKYWGSLGKIEPDLPCLHEYPQIDEHFCPYSHSNRR